jgi:hypothetical protein
VVRATESPLRSRPTSRHLTSPLTVARELRRCRLAWRLPPTRSHGDGQSARFCVWCSVLPAMIIPMITRTIRRPPLGPVAIDGATRVSSVDPTGTDRSDAGQPTTDLAVRPWRCWPLPHLAVPFLVGHRGWRWTGVLPAVQRGVAVGLRDAAAVAGVRSAGSLRLPVSTSRVHCPSVRTVAVRRLRGPGAEPQQVSTEPDTVASGVDSGRPASTRPHPGRIAGTAAAPEQGGDTVVAGRRPSMHVRWLRQWAQAAACGHREGVRGAYGAAATWRCRPDGWTVATERVSGRLRNCTRQASAVHPCVRNRGRCPDGRCPPGTLPSSAGVRCYRKRSPGRRPLVGCSHRRYARASWRWSRSASWART